MVLLFPLLVADSLFRMDSGFLLLFAAKLNEISKLYLSNYNKIDLGAPYRNSLRSTVIYDCGRRGSNKVIIQILYLQSVSESKNNFLKKSLKYYR